MGGGGWEEKSVLLRNKHTFVWNSPRRVCTCMCSLQLLANKFINTFRDNKERKRMESLIEFCAGFCNRKYQYVNETSSIDMRNARYCLYRDNNDCLSIILLIRTSAA